VSELWIGKDVNCRNRGVIGGSADIWLERLSNITETTVRMAGLKFELMTSRVRSSIVEYFARYKEFWYKLWYVFTSWEGKEQCLIQRCCQLLSCNVGEWNMSTPSACFTPFCFNAPCQFTPLINLRSHFRFNALWLAACYYTNALFMMGISFFIYDVFIYTHVFKNATSA
jgi:hypothetical protein